MGNRAPGTCNLCTLHWVWVLWRRCHVDGCWSKPRVADGKGRKGSFWRAFIMCHYVLPYFRVRETWISLSDALSRHSARLCSILDSQLSSRCAWLQQYSLRQLPNQVSTWECSSMLIWCWDHQWAMRAKYTRSGTKTVIIIIHNPCTESFCRFEYVQYVFVDRICEKCK